jgi:peroxiredoxin Q/BCP
MILGNLFAKPIEPGSPAPQASALTDAGELLDIADAASEGLTLVFFYPKANTPGCTAQACSLRDAYEELQDLGVRIIGVSYDSVESQRKFKAKHQLPFTLLADTSGTVVKAFGVPSRGKFAARQAFLFQEGKLVWRDTSASTKKQADDVKQAIAAL